MCMPPCSVARLVASAQRRTTTRLDAHLLLAREIGEMGLDEEDELALRDAAYRRIFPEYAHRLASAWTGVEHEQEGEEGAIHA